MQEAHIRKLARENLLLGPEVIGAINGNVPLAQQDTSGSRVAEYLREIQKAANHARDLVRQILSFSRKQATQIRLIAL